MKKKVYGVLVARRNELLKKLQQKHILTIPASDDVIRLLPSYLIEKKHIDILADAVKSVWK